MAPRVRDITCIRLCALLLLFLLLVPCPGRAADYTLCVTPEGTYPESACSALCDLNSSPLLATIGGALIEASTLPANFDGTRPSVRICVTGEAYHYENVRVEQPDGRIGQVAPHPDVSV